MKKKVPPEALEVSDEHKVNPEWFSRAKLTFIENWPRALCNMSIAQVDIPFSFEETKQFEQFIKRTWEAIDNGAKKPPECDFAVALLQRFKYAMEQFPHGAFVRLGSRSPKDSLVFHDLGGKCTEPSHALQMLSIFSERVVEDVWDCIAAEYPIHIFFREWIEIPEWSEFRCFMRDRKLVGVSQYQYRTVYEELQDPQQVDSIRWAIDRFFEGFSRDCHIDDVVFDVFIKKQSLGTNTCWEVKLLEINPFGAHTDPCLFDHRNEESFDGSTKIFSERNS